MHAADGQLLDVVVLWVLGRVPDQPQEEAVERAVADQACDAHVEEHRNFSAGARKSTQRPQQKKQKTCRLTSCSRAEGLGFKVQGSGFRDGTLEKLPKGLLRASCLGLRFQGLGFRV